MAIVCSYITKDAAGSRAFMAANQRHRDAVLRSSSTASLLSPPKDK
jgi:hypothetical protein